MVDKPKLRSRIWSGLKRHLGLLGLALSPLLLWLFWSFVDWASSDALSRHLWEPVSGFLGRWASQPVGHVGFVVFLWTAAGILVVFALWLIGRSPLAVWLRERWKGPQREEIDRQRLDLDEARKELGHAQIGLTITSGSGIGMSSRPPLVPSIQPTSR
jgi:hypothetical protein